MNKTFQTKLFVAVALFALTASTATARSWRIHHDAAQKADFVSINAAMSSKDVMAGDTLYMDPGCTLTEVQTVTTQVTIVGPGYFRTDSPHNFAYITNNFVIKAPNTKVEGMNLQGITDVYASSCTLERCKTNRISIGSSGNTAQNVVIRQCYIESYIDGCGNTDARSSNAIIENCIIFYNSGNIIRELMNPTISNNYIKNTSESSNNYYCITNVSNATITNNIMFRATAKLGYILSGCSNSIISQNVMSRQSAYTDCPDNIYLGSDDESLIFALEGTNDQKYQLKADSQAKGYATDDGDCGPYGGIHPYVPNGLPANYPYFTKAVIGTRAKDGKVNVSLNIKMQDE